MSYFEAARLSPTLAEGYLQVHWSQMDCIGIAPGCAFDRTLEAPPPLPGVTSTSAERSCSAPASPNSSMTNSEHPQHLQACMAQLSTSQHLNGGQASGLLAQQQAGCQQPPPGLQQVQGQQAQACKASKRGSGGSGGGPAARPAAHKDKKHHLLRHTVTEEARRAAVGRFCGGEAGRAEEGAAGIWKLQQKDLRLAFEAVYGTPTSSCNNGWMRGKLLQALGLSSHWQPPREAPPSPAVLELPPAGLEPGAEVSRFGRRVRRRKYEGSDFEESGEETWVEGSPGPHGDVAPCGGSLVGSARPGTTQAPKRPRASMDDNLRGSPLLGGGSATVVSGRNWRAGVAQLGPAQAGAAGVTAVQEPSTEPNVRIVVRQVYGTGALQDQAGQAVQHGCAAPPAQPPVERQRSEALAFAARFASSRSASPPLQQAASVPALPTLHLAPGALQAASAGAAQLPRSLSAGPAGAVPGAPLLPQESTNLQFYEQQQRLYQQKRNELVQQQRQEIRQRLAVLQCRQAAAGAAPTSMPPLPPAGGHAAPYAAAPTLQAADVPAPAPAGALISSMGHLSAQEWAQHILPPQQAQQAQQAQQQWGHSLALYPRGPAHGRPSASPFAAMAAARAQLPPQQQQPQLLAAGRAQGAGPSVGLAPSLSSELHGLYSAWNDSQLSLPFCASLH